MTGRSRKEGGHRARSHRARSRRARSHRARGGLALTAAVVTVAAVIVGSFALVSCGGGTSPSASPRVTADRATSGIRGIVLLEGGPYMVSPSPLPAGFGSGRQGRPYRFVTVQVTADSGADAGRVVATLKPDRRGLFAVALPPGNYILEPIVQKDGPAPVQSIVVVTAGTFARALVYVEAP